MKKRNTNLTPGFTILELVIVMAIIIIGLSIAYFAFESRASHFRLRGSTRELMEMMKLSQATAIRSNVRHRIVIQSNQQYRFVRFSASLPPGNPQNPASFTASDFTIQDQRISQTFNLPTDIEFVDAGPCQGGSGFPCFSPMFNPDGTINTGAGVSTFQLQTSDPNNQEVYTIQWSIGGGIRIN